jgi:acetyltransferase-like isoleucine patch superfamily enzyme
MQVRRIFKLLVFAIGLAVILPFATLTWVERRLMTGEGVFTLVSQLLALVPGYPGIVLRAAFCYLSLDQCSWEVHVGFGSIFTHRRVTLGQHASVGAYCVIGHADIGERVMMASRVSIPSGKRQHLDDDGRMSREPRFDRVTVGNDSWVGEGAIILADVGRGCIVSAGAVVTSAMPESCVVGGNPARVLGQVQSARRGGLAN